MITKRYYKHITDSGTGFLKFRRKYVNQKSINMSTFRKEV